MQKKCNDRILRREGLGSLSESRIRACLLGMPQKHATHLGFSHCDCGGQTRSSESRWSPMCFGGIAEAMA